MTCNRMVENTRKQTDRMILVRSQTRRAFSLVELMVVIVIIGLLAGTVTVGVRSYMIRSKQSIARTEIARIADALETFYLEFNRYPTNDEGLEILSEPNEKFPEPILSRLPKDPWKNPYAYLETGSTPPYEVASYGADGQEGGEGADSDILSSELGDR